MVLPNFFLNTRANQNWTESGLDSVDKCIDKVHFNNFPYSITYNYNSRGFRDAEWPETKQELQDAIWCIGDSFTVGVGSPIEHTWPNVVSQQQQKRIINVSMDGASNEWIARKSIDIYNEINPSHMIIMWSYFHRREEQSDKSDEDRRNFACMDSGIEDVKNWLGCINRVSNYIKNFIHFIIPNPTARPNFTEMCELIQKTWNNIKGCDWPAECPTTLTEFNKLDQEILNELHRLHKVFSWLLKSLQELEDTRLVEEMYKSQSMQIKNYRGEVPKLDIARDGHHFDILTSQWVAAEVMKIWNRSD
jgi:hypothetical protein